jgi:catechol 2,3-dioxygenase-like lactoylglutathione lyase family enzyme
MVADDKNSRERSGCCHIEVGVKDFDKTLNFYIEGLGFKQRLYWLEGDKRVALLHTDTGILLQICEGQLEDGLWPKDGQIIFCENGRYSLSLDDLRVVSGDT